MINHVDRSSHYFQVAIFRARVAEFFGDSTEAREILMQAHTGFLREGNCVDAEDIEKRMAICAEDIEKQYRNIENGSGAEVEPVAQFLEANKYNVSTIRARDVSSLISLSNRYDDQQVLQYADHINNPQYLEDLLALHEAGEELFVAIASHGGRQVQHEILHRWYRQWYRVLVDHAVIKRDPTRLEASGTRVLQRYDATHRKAFGEASDVGTDCTICMDAKTGNVASGSGLHILEICRHSFHTVCWKKYYESLDGRLNTCPCCRSKIMELGVWQQAWLHV